MLLNKQLKEEINKCPKQIPKKIKDRTVEYEGKKYPKVYIGKGTPSKIFQIYNYMAKNYKFDENTFKGWQKNWKLKSIEEMYKSKKGICHDFAYMLFTILNSFDFNCGIVTFWTSTKGKNDDVVEHSSAWFEYKNNYYYIDVIPLHDDEQVGIFGPFKSLKAIESAEKNSLVDGSFKDAKGKWFHFYSKGDPKPGMNWSSYKKSFLDYNDKSKEIKESLEWIENFVYDEDFRNLHVINESKEYKEEYVPVYVICESYTEKSVKAVNSGMSDEEIKRRMKIANIIRKLTNNDVYTHTLISFDDSMEHMYSYDKEGMVTDSIISNDDWLFTDTIYFAVVFVTKEEKKKMMVEVKKLYDDVKNTKYAYFNFVKMLSGEGEKMDKRFVCSSFVGYVLNLATSKNVHRDYINLRPEDMTILPRSFYIMTVKNRGDFIKKKKQFRAIVKKLYEDNIDDIRDYNNAMPKIMLKDTMKKYNSVTKFFDDLLHKGQR